MRRYLTDREKIRMVEKQHYLCAECGGPLMPANTEYDHTVAGWLVEHRDKPDRAICAVPCHRDKTKADAGIRAKTKRLHRTFVLGERKVKRKIASRPFDKRYTRKISGLVVKRAA